MAGRIAPGVARESGPCLRLGPLPKPARSPYATVLDRHCFVSLAACDQVQSVFKRATQQGFRPRLDAIGAGLTRRAQGILLQFRFVPVPEPRRVSLRMVGEAQPRHACQLCQLQAYRRCQVALRQIADIERKEMA